MEYYGYGRVIRGVGGLFSVWMLDRNAELLRKLDPMGADTAMPLDGMLVCARGRGHLRQKGSLLAGDLVRVSYNDSSFSQLNGTVTPSADGTAIVIEEICPRSCALIRPPMANLNVLFVTVAAASPDPVLQTVDKLICIAEHNGIEPVVVVTKSDLDPTYAEELVALYKKAGFEAFCQGAGRDSEELGAYIASSLDGKVAAFSGASGVGKSTLLNRLFPELALETGEISRRIERGKNTTRRTELFRLSQEPDSGFLADTPGFTMLDFERFDFFEREDLPATFREFTPYIGSCRYTKCSHTKEQGCAIIEAVERGEIAHSRHQSFVELFEVLKKKTRW